MSEKSLINPYLLLGLTVNSSLADVKKAYYGLALLLHPDKGGSAQDMIVLCKAYNYIKKQIQMNVDKSEMDMEKLEKEFESFCKEQENRPPTFTEIYKETDEKFKDFSEQLQRFNRQYTECKAEEEMKGDVDIFRTQGYGHLMDESKNNASNTSYNPNVTTERVTHTFNNQLVEYKEPDVNNSSYTHQPFNVRHIEDFSHKTGTLAMADYKKGFSKELQPETVLRDRTYNEIVNERSDFESSIRNNRNEVRISIQS